MLLAIIRQVAGCYLAITLAATGLAKLRSWRTASTGVIVEKVIPRELAPATVVAVSVAELALAALFASGIFPVLAGCASALLFLSFGGYKATVSIKTGNLGCTCSGKSTAYRATRPGVLAALAASLIQAALALTWASSTAHVNLLLQLPVLVAFVIPFGTYALSLDPRVTVSFRPVRRV